MKRKGLSILALLLVLSVFLCACGKQGASKAGQTAAEAGAAGPKEAEQAEETKEASGGELKIGVLGEPDSLYPPNSATGGLCLAPVYETLLSYNYETGELDPCLAESWEYVDDTTLVFHIREGVKFSDGTDMDANDVLFSFQKSMDETTQTYSVLSFIDIENSYVEDDYTIVFKFLEPTASGPMIMSTTDIFSEDYFNEVGIDKMATAPLGTGPYAVTEWKSGYSISYERNEYYWGDSAFFDSMAVKFYSESTTMMIDYETEALDMALGIPENDVKRVQNGDVENTNLYLTPTFETYVFTMYKGCEKLQDERVRQAIAHAIDRSAIAEYSLGILGTPADSIMASSIQFYTPCDGYDYDPDAAKALLEAAGVEDLELTCLLETSNVISDMAEILQAQLAEVGIKLNVEIYDIGTVIPKWIGLENDMIPEGDCVIMASSLTLPDPDYRCTGFKQGSGLTMIEVTDSINEMLFEARQTLDDAERQAKYEEVQQAIVTEAFNIPLAESLKAFVVRDSLTGFSGLDPNGYDFYKVAEG